MINLYKKYSSLLLNLAATTGLLTASFITTHAQCEAPTLIGHTSTAITCPSNGTITMGAVTGGSGDFLEYALYNAANTVEIKPWQTGSIFNELASGTYTMRARYVCSSEYSDTYIKTITVGGSYTVPSIININVSRRAQCDNGRISISGVNGTPPYTYA